MLFICGVPRSGTTALAHLLNRHPAIGLGIERYRLLAQRDASCLGEELFTRERFFDFREGDGARDVWEKYQDEYGRLASKWATCTIVGDKIPRLYVGADTLLRTQPQARLIFIRREVEPVAASWQRRADDAQDPSWPATNDAAAAVFEWNRGIRSAVELAAAWPERFLVVPYEDLLAGDPGSFDPLFEWLALTPPEGFAAAYAELGCERPSSAPPLSPRQSRQVRGSADFGSFAALSAIARRLLG